MIPKRLPVRSFKTNKKTLCDFKYAVRIQLILTSQMYPPEEQPFVEGGGKRCGYGGPPSNQTLGELRNSRE